MKETLKKFRLMFATVALVAIVGLVVVSCNPPEPTVTTSATTEVADVVVQITPGTAAYVGLKGSIMTNESGEYVYDSSWGGGAVHKYAAKTAVNDDGVVVIEFKDFPASVISNGAITNQFVLGLVTGTNEDHIKAGGDWVGSLKFYMMADTDKWLLEYVAPNTFSADCTLRVTLDTTAISHIDFDLDGDGTAGEVGDYTIGGNPDPPFGGFAFAAGPTNDTAYSAGGTLFSSITIPAGTSTSLDVSIWGTDTESGATNTAKVQVATVLANVATATLNVVAKNEDGGYQKFAANYSGDVLPTRVTTNK